jgi:hypothetical protein
MPYFSSKSAYACHNSDPFFMLSVSIALNLLVSTMFLIYAYAFFSDGCSCLWQIFYPVTLL